MRTYTSDPRWISARFDSITKIGEKIKRGDQVLYFPADRSIMTGEAAKQAWRDFEAAAMDDHFMSGRMY
jgi:hypothetical protein